LLSIREVPNSDDRSCFDLNIHTRSGQSYSADNFDELIIGGDYADYVPTDVHISVHCNPRSGETNTVKRSIRSPGQPTTSRVLVTTGIKKENKFVPILFRVCGDLSQDRFNLPSKCDDELVDLGNFDPAKYQLRFMLVLSASGKSFDYDREHPSNCIQHPLKDFNLTILWSYFNFPARPHGINYFMYSKADTGTVSGYDWWEVYNQYTDFYHMYAARYFAIYGDN
jgi:hypothetical protein